MEKQVHIYHDNIAKLVYLKEFDEVTEAIAREKQIKYWSRKKKEWLIKQLNPDWEDLYVRSTKHQKQKTGIQLLFMMAAWRKTVQIEACSTPPTIQPMPCHSDCSRDSAFLSGRSGGNSLLQAVATDKPSLRNVHELFKGSFPGPGIMS